MKPFEGKRMMSLTYEEICWIKHMRQLKKCAEKTNYETQREANLAANYQMNKHKTLLTIYKCDLCSFWHLTSSI